ncbi:TPA: hypothetical protein P2R00_003605 [Aeromonas veronii]|uniref:hypothetical protein n=1 Tax=Aeromonas veronii TaxID=654 RepID=UPI00094691DA|nr:hypothetical protein [Aeromonas veronii]OLF59879.1 hypothetical protein BTN33_08865 [Aeromonas veronii]HDO1376304.1 hypothetical protein [Aeromonas veronii]
MAKQHQVRAKSANGSELAVSSHDSDSPILPVAQLEKLHSFRPDLVDFVVEQTKIEAEDRRARTKRVDRYILTERLFGMVCSVFVCGIGVIGGGYVGLQGQPWLGGIIASAALGTLAVAFIRRQP